MYCRQCGKEIKETDIYCSNCGAKIELENVEIGDDISNITEDKETKFDSFMKKMFFQNKELTNEVLEQAGKINVIGIVLIQFVAFALLLLFDIEIPSSGITLFWWLFDCYVLKKQGIHGKWKIWGFFIIPVYLCIRAKKTNKKYIWAIISILVCVLGIGGAVVSELYGGTEVSSDSTSNSQLYIWEIDGYSKAQGSEDINISLFDYIPRQNMTLTYSQWIDSTHKKSIDTIESTSYDGSHDMDFSTTTENWELLSYGYYWYDEQYDCVYKTYIENVLGHESTNAILISNGKSFTFDSGNEISSPPHLFTITTKAGKFEDCLCIGETKEEADGTYTTIRFYAPKIGLVLEESYDPHTESVYGVDGFVVTYELTKILK